MGIDYSFNVAFGYVVGREELRNLSRIVQATSHVEDRFDEKNGRKLDPVLVVDAPEHRQVVLSDGSEYDDFNDACEELARRAGCEVDFFGDCYDADEVPFAVFSPAVDPELPGTNTSLDSHIDVGHSLDYRQISSESVRNSVNMIGKRLLKLGVLVDVPRVLVKYVVS